MTDSQRHLFANKMSEMPEMSKYSQGTESYQQFAVRIAEMLLHPEKFRELYPLLKKAGFKQWANYHTLQTKWLSALKTLV